MPNNTDSPQKTGHAPFRFGLDTRSNKPDTFHLSLQVGDTWYETNALFSDHLMPSEFIRGLNNAVITGHNPSTEGGHIAFAFNTLYEQTHDSHRVIIHLEHSVILTGYLIDTDTITPAEFCNSMNRQTCLSNRDRHELIMNCIVGGTNINELVPLH